MEQNPDRVALWERFKREHPRGSWLTGRVEKCATYGVWVDLGVPFNALLLIPYIARHQPRTQWPLRPEEWPQEEEPIKVMIRHYGDDIVPGSVGDIALTQDPASLWVGVEPGQE